MKILVTNDDGVNAEGLWALVSVLREVGDVTVVAPDREQSGVATSMTFHSPVRITQLHEKMAGIPTYSVEGTPADCVIMAIKVIMKGDWIDMVVSGINPGPNCGYDVFLSGTVGAALQGYFYAIPSIAISIDSFESPLYETGAVLAGEIVRYLQEKGHKSRMLLNVNAPNIPLNQVQGIDVTRMGEKVYSARIEQGNDGRHDYYWIQHSAADTGVVRGTDLWALKHKRISITPLRFNRSEWNTDFVQDMAANLAGRLLDNKLCRSKED